MIDDQLSFTDLIATMARSCRFAFYNIRKIILSNDNIFQILLNNIIGINQKRGFLFDLFIIIIIIIIVIYANEIQCCLNFDILNICICVLQKN